VKTQYAIRLGPHRAAVADVHPLGRCHWITRINVPREYRGRGYGTALLEQVLEDADREGVTLRLEINPYGDFGIPTLW